MHRLRQPLLHVAIGEDWRTPAILRLIREYTATNTAIAETRIEQ
jgi:hypothetical protein